MGDKITKILVVSNGATSDPRDILCFRFLPKQVKLGFIGPKVPLLNLSAVRIAIKYLRQYALVYFFCHEWDVVISTSFLDGLGLSIFQLLGLRKRPKHIIIDLQASLRMSALVRPLLSMIMRSTSKIVCFTNAQRNWWNSQLGSKKAVFIPIGITDYKRIALGNVEKDYIFSGGMSSRDYATLVAAAEKINARFVIVAGKDAITRKTGLEGLILPSNIEFHCGLSYDQFMCLLNESTLVVLPLKDVNYACGQTVLLQAFAASKPVIVTKIPGIWDYVEDGKTAMFVKPENPDDLMKTISSLLNNEGLRRYLGQNARRVIETKLNAQEMGKNFFNVIENTLFE